MSDGAVCHQRHLGTHTPQGYIAFYLALAAALLIAGAAAFPAKRWPIRRGKGHAVVHPHHAH